MHINDRTYSQQVIVLLQAFMQRVLPTVQCLVLLLAYYAAYKQSPASARPTQTLIPLRDTVLPSRWA